MDFKHFYDNFRFSGAIHHIAALVFGAIRWKTSETLKFIYLYHIIWLEKKVRQHFSFVQLFFRALLLLQFFPNRIYARQSFCWTRAHSQLNSSVWEWQRLLKIDKVDNENFSRGDLPSIPFYCVSATFFPIRFILLVDSLAFFSHDAHDTIRREAEKKEEQQ